MEHLLPNMAHPKRAHFSSSFSVGGLLLQGHEPCLFFLCVHIHWVQVCCVARVLDRQKAFTNVFSGSIALVQQKPKMFDHSRNNGKDEDEAAPEIRWGNIAEDGQVSRVLVAGDLMGEEALLHEWQWPDTIQAMSCCEVQLLTRAAFLSVMEAFPHELDRCTRLGSQLWPSQRWEQAAPHTKPPRLQTGG